MSQLRGNEINIPARDDISQLDMLSDAARRRYHYLDIDLESFDHVLPALLEATSLVACQALGVATAAHYQEPDNQRLLASQVSDKFVENLKAAWQQVDASGIESTLDSLAGGGASRAVYEQSARNVIDRFMAAGRLFVVDALIGLDDAYHNRRKDEYTQYARTLAAVGFRTPPLPAAEPSADPSLRERIMPIAVRGVVVAAGGAVAISAYAGPAQAETLQQHHGWQQPNGISQSAPVSPGKATPDPATPEQSPPAVPQRNVTPEQTPAQATASASPTESATESSATPPVTTPDTGTAPADGSTPATNPDTPGPNAAPQPLTVTMDPLTGKAVTTPPATTDSPLGASQQQNTLTAVKTATTLQPLIVDGLTQQAQIIKDGNLGVLSQSPNDVFDTTPTDLNGHKVKLTASPETKQRAQVMLELQRGVLANDPLVISTILNYYNAHPGLDSTQQDLLTIVNGYKFTEQGKPDLSEQQKTAMLQLMHSMQMTFRNEASHEQKAAAQKLRSQIKHEAKQHHSHIDGRKIAQHWDAFSSLSAQQKQFAIRLTTAAVKAEAKGAPINAAGIISQGILESGWGTSSLASRYNNFFGVKAGDGWHGRTVEMPTQEWDSASQQFVATTAKFKVYPSLEAAIGDYVKLLEDFSWYDDALRCTKSPSEFLNSIEGATGAHCQPLPNVSQPGWATDPQYVAHNMALVHQFGLVQITEHAWQKTGGSRHAGNQHDSKHAPGSQFPALLPDGTPYVSQWDNRWANDPYNPPGQTGRTIWSSGCGPSTQAWVLRYMKLGTPTPAVEAGIDVRIGARVSDGTDSYKAFKALAERNHLHFESIGGLSESEQIAKIHYATQHGGVAVFAGTDNNYSTPFTTAGHILGVYAINQHGAVKVMDPNSLSRSGKWWGERTIIGRATNAYIIYK